MSLFEIHTVQVGNGTVALSALPGRDDSYPQDLKVIRDWRPDLVISMTTEAEMLQQGAAGLGDDLRAHNIRWHHLPVADFGAPSPMIDALWGDVCVAARRVLAQGGRVLVHCRGGCGRSGMIVLRIMVEHGEMPEAALKRLRVARPCAVETDGQLEWAAQAARR
ncbi:protein-tyrosine phosphatase family protein [Ruegeria halocynthiae]|uniref:protein-tyrosine phosphatase family protein n=1 Tax=Ruegeria halocynthiae TaxID=985054 RepID=UPI000561770F|nr:protein-tyrosine phosphatase family protein [Ruegeria halocynthiae]